MDCKHLDPELRLAAHMAFDPNPELNVHRLGLPDAMIRHIIPPLPDAGALGPAVPGGDLDGANAVGDLAPDGHDVDLDTVDGQPTTTIVDLNDDCLLAIYQYLDIVDIVHASEAIRGLSEFAERSVYHKYSRLSMNDYIRRVHEMWPRWRLVMQHIGPHLRELVLNKKMLMHINIEPVVFVLQHCVNLRVLRLENFQFQGQKYIEWMLRVEHFVPERLELVACTGMTVENGFDKVLAKFVNLRSLTILCYPCNMNLLMGVHGLEQLVLVYMSDTNGMLSRVLTNQGDNLKRLTMIDITPDILSTIGDITPDILSNIGDTNPNLVELRVQIGTRPTLVRALHKLRHLKRLQLVDDPDRLVGNEFWYLKPFEQLECLELSMFHSDLLDAAVQVSTLKTLIARCPCITNYTTLFTTVAGLSNLTSLQLSSFIMHPSAPIRLLRSNTNLCEMILDRCLTTNPALKEIADHLTALHTSKWRRPFELTVISQFPINWKTEWGVLVVNRDCREIEINIRPVLKLRVQYTQSPAFTTTAGPDYLMSSAERISQRLHLIFTDLLPGLYRVIQ